MSNCRCQWITCFPVSTPWICSNECVCMYMLASCSGRLQDTWNGSKAMFASSRSRPPSAAESARSSAAGTTGTTRKPLDSRASQCSAVQANALDKDYAKPWVHTHKHKFTHTDMHKHTPIIGSSRLPWFSVLYWLIESMKLIVHDIDVCFVYVFRVCVFCVSAHSKRPKCSKTCSCVQWD